MKTPQIHTIFSDSGVSGASVLTVALKSVSRSKSLLNHGQLLNSLSEVLLDVINYYASKLIAHKPRNDIYRKNSAIKIHWKFQSLFRIKTTYWDELYLFPLLAVHCKTENKTIKDKIKIFLNKKMKITKCKDRERERVIEQDRRIPLTVTDTQNWFHQHVCPAIQNVDPQGVPPEAKAKLYHSE